MEDITIWLYCYAWGDQAESTKRSVSKGALLFVQGDFTSHPYTAEDGRQEVRLEVNVKEFSLAERSALAGIGQPSAEILPLRFTQGFGSRAQDDNGRSLL